MPPKRPNEDADPSETERGKTRCNECTGLNLMKKIGKKARPRCCWLGVPESGCTHIRPPPPPPKCAGRPKKIRSANPGVNAGPPSSSLSALPSPSLSQFAPSASSSASAMAQTALAAGRSDTMAGIAPPSLFDGSPALTSRGTALSASAASSVAPSSPVSAPFPTVVLGGLAPGASSGPIPTALPPPPRPLSGAQSLGAPPATSAPTSAPPPRLSFPGTLSAFVQPVVVPASSQGPLPAASASAAASSPLPPASASAFSPLAPASASAPNTSSLLAPSTSARATVAPAVQRAGTPMMSVGQEERPGEDAPPVEDDAESSSLMAEQDDQAYRAMLEERAIAPSLAALELLRAGVQSAEVEEEVQAITGHMKRCAEVAKIVYKTMPQRSKATNDAWRTIELQCIKISLAGIRDFNATSGKIKSYDTRAMNKFINKVTEHARDVGVDVRVLSTSVVPKTLTDELARTFVVAMKAERKRLAAKEAVDAALAKAAVEHAAELALRDEREREMQAELEARDERERRMQAELEAFRARAEL